MLLEGCYAPSATLAVTLFVADNIDLPYTRRRPPLAPEAVAPFSPEEQGNCPRTAVANLRLAFPPVVPHVA